MVVRSKFSGHVAVPGLARDMIDPTQFDQMIDTAYIIATTLYGVIGIAGALGFFRCPTVRSPNFRLLHVWERCF